MMEDAITWNGYFLYKNQDGEEMVLFTTCPNVEALLSAPAVWIRKKDEPVNQAKLQVQGFAASIISLAINHYWRVHRYDNYGNPMKEPAAIEDIDCMLYCRKSVLFSAYMKEFAPIAHEVWEQSPTLPLECSEGDNWYTYMYACECEARVSLMQSELYQCLPLQQQQIIYGYTSHFIEYLAKNYPVSVRIQHQIMEALARNLPSIELHIENHTQIHRLKENCKKLSTFLIPQADPCADDDDIQTHLEEAAESGATCLANYLSSEEGQRHFNFRNMSRPQVLSILNEECGTNIKDDTFYRACRLCDLTFPNKAMR